MENRMLAPRSCLTFVLATLILAPAAGHAAQGVDNLDVTIRMLDRQNPDIDAFINRIELPGLIPAGIADHSRPGGAEHRQHEGRRDASAARQGSERARETIRERADRSGSHGDERRQHAAEIVDSMQEARERRQDAQESTRQLRQDARDEMREAARPSRND
jgi:hypothetical protein